MQRLPILKGTLVSAGVDWISVTQRPGDDMEVLRTIALALAEVELSADMYGSPYAAQGYQGFRVGSITYGERDDGCLMRLGGALAQGHWRRVAQHARHITRLDLQATFQTNIDPSLALKRHYSEMKAHSKKFKRAAQPELFLGRDESVTVYSGRRVSDTFLRAYDKGRESKLAQWLGCLRYEAEFKGQRSSHLTNRLAAIVNEHPISSTLVLELFRKRGAGVRNLLEVSQDCTSLCKWLRVPARVSDVERTLSWLSRSVRPSVDAIVRRQGESVARRVLGLPQS